MSWLKNITILVIGTLASSVIKQFFRENEIIVLKKEDIESVFEDESPRDIKDLKPENYDKAMDLRGAPTHVCPCGCNIWNVKVMFQDNQIATYFLDMECANCGSLATAPTPIDADGMGL